MAFGPPQGFFQWPGMESFLYGSFPFSAHGIQPSVAVIYIAPQATTLATTGTLVVGFGADIQEFPGCLLDFISIHRDEEGKVTWGLHIKDRRWVWEECGYLAGRYNVRRGDGDLEGDNPALPQQLATLAFEALNETFFDVSQLPEDDLPEIDWDYCPAAPALQELADKYGCRVVLGLDNTVRLMLSGVGANLPQGTYMAGAVDYNPPNYPSQIIVAAAKTRVQFDLLLQPVGLEVAGTQAGQALPINDLSYTPPGGWSIADVDVMLSVTDPTARAAAVKSVYRWYQVTAGFVLDGVDINNVGNWYIEYIDQILPLDDVQLIEQATDETPGEAGPEDTVQPLPAWVYGIWYDGQEICNNVCDFIDPTISSPDQTLGYYPRGFTINKEQGIVQFNQPVVSTDGFGNILPAALMLRTSFSVQDVNTLQFLRMTSSTNTPNAQLNTPPKLVKREDVGRQIIYATTATGGATIVSDNYSAVSQALNYYLQAELQKYSLDEPQQFSYPGFRFDIQPDGAICQLTWTVSPKGDATCSAVRNKEDLSRTISFTEKKRRAKIKQMVDAERTARAQAQDQRLKQTGRASGLL